MKPKKSDSQKIDIQTGDWFLVPLDEGCFALGIVALVQNLVVLGYFFPKVYVEVPSKAEINQWKYTDAIFIHLTSGWYLENGKWPIIHHSLDFKKSSWPLTDFGSIDSLDPKIAYRTRYIDGNIGQLGYRWSVSPEEIVGLPQDGLAGVGFVELRLRRLLQLGNVDETDDPKSIKIHKN